MNGINLPRTAGGYTRPGHLPLARLDGFLPLFTQHHEALHHHFNSLTTVGNSLNLLGQLAIKCPDPLGKVAKQVASRWSDAQVNLLEGLINYVAHKRTTRRLDPSAVAELDRIAEEASKGLWAPWRTRYDHLPVSDLSRDALAMHVGVLTLNIPVYDALADLSNLSAAIHVVSEPLITARLEDIEEVLFSSKGLMALKVWDYEMQRLTATDLPEESKQNAESDAFYLLLNRLNPCYISVPRGFVPQSVALAENWNRQLTALGLPESCRVEIKNVGYVDAIKHEAYSKFSLKKYSPTAAR